MTNNTSEILIIGAGAAGLAAANILSARGKNVTILEARPRIGGRIETLHDPAWPLPIERGAEFIHGKPKETFDIIKAGALAVYDVTDGHWVYQNGKLQKNDDFFEEVEKVLAVTNRVHGADVSFNDAVARYGKGFSPDAVRAAKSYVEGFDAADSSLVSARWLSDVQKASDKIDGDLLFRVHAGYDRIIQFLRTGINDPSHRIELSTLVRRIQWSKEGATVETVNDRGDIPIFHARKVLITVPIGVLQAPSHVEGHIAFIPELPAQKRAALNLMKMGAVLKIVLHFRDPFWEKAIPDLAFFHAPGSDEPFPTFWTTLPLRTNILTGWSGGPQALRLSEKSPAALLEAALGTISRILKMPRRKLAANLVASHVCNWQADPFSRGAYSYAGVNGARASEELATPIASTLFFAGEAVHSKMTGTVAAAIASGHHAARQILRAG